MLLQGFSLLLLAASGSAFLDFQISCHNYLDYAVYNFSGTCFHDPDVKSDLPSILQRHVGNYEKYEVKTEDGYFLTLFRIKRENPKGVVILQHPVTTDAVIWMLQKEESLALILYNAGYDVWMPNHRGTRYSQKHENLTIHDYAFWDFSFHEIGVYDYRSNINFISNMTGRNDLVFVGNSLSSTASILYAALFPEEAKAAVKVFIEISPVVYFQHAKSALMIIGYLSKLFEIYSNIFQDARPFNPNSLQMILAKSLLYFPFKKVGVYLLELIGGWSNDEYNPVHFNRMVSSAFQEFSFKCAFHYAQMLKSKGFAFYDYGREKNLALYKSEKPPEYPLKDISVPIYMLSSSADSAGSTEDAETFYNNLPDVAKVYGKHLTYGLNHFDYHFGRHRMERIIDPIMNLLNKIF